MKARYLRRKRKRYIVLFVIAAVAAAVFCIVKLARPQVIEPNDIAQDELSTYLTLAEETGTDWRFFACAVRFNGEIDEGIINSAGNGEIAGGDDAAFIGCLKSYFFVDEEQLEAYVFRLSLLDSIIRNGGFPVTGDYHYSDTWGAARTYGGERKHEGTDIMCDAGTHICAAAPGKITRIGWNELGGWRIGVTDKNGAYYYYAHLSGYASGVKKGVYVEQGDVIGYAGDTGYGPEGTSGKFAPHLHFGMYYNGEAFNPYPYLCYWETSPE